MSRRKSSRETVPVAGPSFERSPAARSHQPAMSSGKVLRPVIRMTSAQSVVAQLVDMIRTNSAYSDDVLLSSREGEIEDELIIDPTHRG